MYLPRQVNADFILHAATALILVLQYTRNLCTVTCCMLTLKGVPVTEWTSDAWVRTKKVQVVTLNKTTGSQILC